MAQTPFEADAWAEALREIRVAVVNHAQQQHGPHVAVLAQAGRDVNVPEQGNGRTALHYAAVKGQLDRYGAGVDDFGATTARGIRSGRWNPHY